MKMKDLKKLKCYTRLRKRKQFVSWTIFSLFAISFSSSVDAQQLTRQQVMDTIYTMPAFSMYQDNYMISGIPLHTDTGSETADVKYQISFKNLLNPDGSPAGFISIPYLYANCLLEFVHFLQPF